jgi:hypothetical protein
MREHAQRLTLGLEARHDLLAVHAELDDLERDDAAGRVLLGLVNHPHAPFADAFQDPVRPDLLGSLRRLPIGSVRWWWDFNGVLVIARRTRTPLLLKTLNPLGSRGLKARIVHGQTAQVETIRLLLQYCECPFMKRDWRATARIRRYAPRGSP